MLLWIMAAGVVLGFLVILAIVLATRMWNRGVVFGRVQGMELMDASLSMLANRVDDRRSVLAARETVPAEFRQKTDQEVIEWAESVVSKWRSLRRSL